MFKVMLNDQPLPVDEGMRLIENKTVLVSSEQVVEYVVGRIRGNPVMFQTSMENIARCMWKQGLHINAIKLIYDLFPVGLRGAKEHCEEIFKDL